MSYYSLDNKMKFHPTNLLPKKLTTSRGFSIIELIVAVSIMIIITTAVLFRQSKFSSDILITNMAYEVALAIRQAQVYGTSSKQNSLGGIGTNQYKVGYGIHIWSAGNVKPNSYAEFVDVPTNPAVIGEDTVFEYTYDSDGSEDLGDDPELSQVKIRQYCGYIGTNPGNCWSDGDTSLFLDIVFVKPNPDAHIRMGSTVGSHDGNEYDKAKIVIESALGDKCRTVTVYGSGQISVDPADSSGGCDPL
jgi:type II secretory pathway pseudopilin PulG